MNDPRNSNNLPTKYSSPPLKSNFFPHTEKGQAAWIHHFNLIFKEAKNCVTTLGCTKLNNAPSPLFFMSDTQDKETGHCAAFCNHGSAKSLASRH